MRDDRANALVKVVGEHFTFLNREVVRVARPRGKGGETSKARWRFKVQRRVSRNEDR